MITESDTHGHVKAKNYFFFPQRQKKIKTKIGTSWHLFWVHEKKNGYLFWRPMSKQKIFNALEWVMATQKIINKKRLLRASLLDDTFFFINKEEDDWDTHIVKLKPIVEDSFSWKFIVHNCLVYAKNVFWVDGKTIIDF